MLLLEIADTSAAVAESPGRLAKIDRLAACLRRLEPGEADIAVAFLTGELRQRQIGVGYAALRDQVAAAQVATLTLVAVDTAFARIGCQTGPGSQGERRRLLADLLSRASEPEQRFLRALLAGDLRQGALGGIMVEAVARGAAVAASEVRRALMLRGALGPVATLALEGGAQALRGIRLEVGRAIQPMLAQTASGTDDAMRRLCPAAVEWKLDGARIQVHRADGDVRVFTRTLDDITARVPEVVQTALALPVRSVVLDGEVLVLHPDQRPEPFRVTAGRVGSSLNVQQARASLPLRPFLFDVLHLDGADLLDRPGAERRTALARLAPDALRVPRVVADTPNAAAQALNWALERGHEGVVVKSLTAPYEAGRRGAGWLKVKPRHTLDLVVLAAEWGHGRRRGWLSNLHLGAGDPAAGGFVMLGKTFKGMTDAMLRWQTERLLELEVSRNEWLVAVRADLVVEVAFDGVQHSPRYPAGLTLRFARVLRHRPDKRAHDADTIDTIRAIYGGRSG